MTPFITQDQADALVRGVSLIRRYDVLSAFEAGLLQDCIERYRLKGDRTVLTANEWRVIEEAMGALDAAHADRLRAINAAAASRRPDAMRLA
jgi:hypothetical protein